MSNRLLVLGCAVVCVFLVLALLVPVMAVAFFANQSGDDKKSADTSIADGSVRDKITEIAKKEIGYDEQPPGSNIVPRFGSSGDPWCSYFVTWVWNKAGVNIPTLPCSGSVGQWAQTHTKWKPAAGAKPEPGDAIIYGTGDSCPASVHIGIVEKVNSNGMITTIEGNYADTVSRRGPFDPKSQNVPGPVFGFAAPVK